MVAKSEETIDHSKLRPAFFKAPRRPEVVDLPEASYLVIDGVGSPDGAGFQDAIAALYGVAYTLKMTFKKRAKDFKVPTFGGSWWVFSPAGELPREQWRWQLQMMLPDFVTEEDVAKAKKDVATKKRQAEPPVRFERFAQGLCVQALHVGPYDTEQLTIDQMQALMAERHLRQRGAHHEVYLGDPRRAKPENLKTILRHPVEAVA
jgi:hypothetical protein